MTISEADLASIREEAATFLPQSVVVRRRTQSSDGAGGQIEDWFDVGSYAGRLDYGSGSESVAGGRETDVDRWRLKLERGADLVATDRVIVGLVEGDTPKTVRDKTFEVLHVEDRPFNAYVEADVARPQA